MTHHQITRDQLPLNQLAKAQGHKFAHGHALVLSGGAGRSGAARLAARAALRVGAGLVTLAVPPEALAEVASQITAIMLQPVADARALAKVLEDDRFKAICLGPALGTGKGHAALVASCLAARRATVLDADALTLLAKDKPLFSALHESCVLTPHAGEFARLFPDLAEKLANAPGFGKPEATQEAAARAGCIVVLKGAKTTVAHPDGLCGQHSATGERAAPWLATAGAGDVLAGLITGLMARGFGPALAAELGVWLHVEAALSFGPGLIAEDLPEELPRVLNALLA
ncbi:NAD(P)H-hydrate dehydratase [Roseobacter weihaiensis]|uniref:NAD(P)H-hydrate dehydratase n=1 Tax=Roseobacter weihaiensis TaxID=2763262 RepID=UPI0029CAC322|nr:NAD(P)H-hydrate dehydratase [Roseobacter sp. H9]